MKRLFSILFTATLLSVFAAGCDNTEDKSANADIPVETEAVTEATEEATEPERKYTPQRGEFLYDDARVLSPSDFKAVNQTAADFTAKYRVNTGVVITDNTGEKAPKDLAAEYYKELCGNANGLLLLINNDTGKDYVMRKGSPSLFVTDEDIQLLLADISPLLVTGDYYGAVTKTFELFENNIPEYVTDRTNLMEKEQIEAINQKLKDASSEEKTLSVIYTSQPACIIDEYADSQIERYINTETPLVIMCVDITTGNSAVRAYNGAQSGNATTEFKTAICECFNDEASFDFEHSVDIFIKYFGK